MILAIDIGNTNITIGGYNRNGSLILTSRIATDPRRTADQYAVEIYDVFRLHGATVAEVQGCAISSVVPAVGTAVEQALKNLCGIQPVVIGPGIKTGLNIKIDNPAQLGADLVAGAVGALHKYPAPCIIIDMGTATTLSLIDQNGTFLGGAIAAGVGLTLEALAQNTAQLPSVVIKAPESAVGTNTVACMQSGLVFGTADMIDGMITRFEKQLGAPCTVVATGGRAPQIVPHCAHKIIIDDNLLLDGLKVIFEKNAPAAQETQRF